MEFRESQNKMVLCGNGVLLFVIYYEVAASSNSPGSFVMADDGRICGTV